MLEELKQLRNWLKAIEDRNNFLEAQNYALKRRNAILEEVNKNCFYQADRLYLENEDLKRKLKKEGN